MPKPNLYRERSSENLQPRIDRLNQLENGASPLNLPSPEELTDILQFEDGIGKKLETIYSITPVVSTISLTYLKTTAGKADFETVFNLSLPEGEMDDDTLRGYLYENEETIKATDAKQRVKFEGRAVDHTEVQMTEALLQTLSDDLRIDCKNLTTPASNRFLLTPEKSLAKITGLRQLKQELKDQYATLDQERTNDTVVKQGLIDLYLRRINELLSDLSQTGRSLKQKVALGLNLTETEQALYEMVYVAEDYDRVLARLDRFQYGAALELDSSGNHPQISPGLLTAVEQSANEYNQAILAKSELMAEKGLDPTLVEDEKGYTPDQIQQIAEEVLASYGILSSESPDTFDPTRSGAAADDKWQVIISDKYNSMEVSGKQKIVKIPNKPMSAKRLFSVGLAHEIEGHALQHTNKTKLGLRLFQKVGSDRSTIFAEGGAKFNENLVSKEAFGVSSTAMPHYIRGMQTKLNGGNFADCLSTIYESSIQPYRTLLTTEQITDEEAKKIAKKEIKLAIRRTKRLFRGGGNTTSENGQLTSSKDTAYLEGVILSQKLTEANLQKFMFLTGVNLDAIIFLLENNLISTADIQGPTYKTLEIWEREKSRFMKKA